MDGITPVTTAVISVIIDTCLSLGWEERAFLTLSFVLTDFLERFSLEILCPQKKHLHAHRVGARIAAKLPCWLLPSPLHQPTPSTSRSLLCPCRETAKGRLAAERWLRDPNLSSSITWLRAVQLPCGGPRRVHDGIMGLVSCLDQLHVRIVCAFKRPRPHHCAPFPAGAIYVYSFSAPRGHYSSCSRGALAQPGCHRAACHMCTPIVPCFLLAIPTFGSRLLSLGVRQTSP